ncbi:MAG: single-stranded-DNA-specific exonuclease RecJ [Chlamydiae bacterium]|nr:single-stranded-DNA-specific exonuclease RecJ [Chlamydiota bacterium]
MPFLPKKQEISWVFPRENPPLVQRITREFNINPVTAQILVSRGFTSMVEIHHYLYAKLPDLHSPSLMPQIDQAVDRLYRAIQDKESILVFGDNDVDGITGTVLLTDFFRRLGVTVFYSVPNRNQIKESIMSDAIETALEKGCKLIITVDCGLTSTDDVERADRYGIDVIVTDHHEPGSQNLRCVATLNPKLYQSTYPNRDLTGVGVAFKLAHALLSFLSLKGTIDPEEIDLKDMLDIVAIGTVADMGSLRGENRILVRYGLNQIPKTGRIGLLKLLNLSDLNAETITTGDIASKLAPRLNSLGRISDPMKGVELLLTRDFTVATNLVDFIDKKNQERQKIERRDSLEIEKMIEQHPDLLEGKAIVLFSKTCHPGIIAIIAARLSKLHNRPTVVVTEDKGVLKASVRTIPEFPILPVLRENDSILMNYGGHDYAAGFTISPENFPQFKEHFLQAAERSLSDTDLFPKLMIDAKVSFKDLTFDFLESLSLLEPFGVDNPQPTLYCEADQVFPPKVIGKVHLKFYLEENGRQLEGIGFNLASRRHELLKKKGSRLIVAFTPTINSYQEKTSIQLQIKDFQALPRA